LPNVWAAKKVMQAILMSLILKNPEEGKSENQMKKNRGDLTNLIISYRNNILTITL